jgi:hypothetical protein
LRDPDFLIGAAVAQARPGLEVVTVENAALAMSWLSVEVLAQESKSLPLLDEFVLRLLAEGIDSESGIAEVLGLESALVTSTVADQMVAGFVTRSRLGDGTFILRLTSHGVQAARELADITPKQVALSYAFDLLVRRLTAYPRAWFINSGDVRRGVFRKLPMRSDIVDAGEVTVRALNRLVSGRGIRNDSRLEILSCQRVSQRANLFLPVKLIIYTDVSGTEVQLAVSIEGEISKTHELEISGAGGVEAMGIRVEQAPNSGDADLSSRLTSMRTGRDIVMPLMARSLSADFRDRTDASTEADGDSDKAKRELDGIPVRYVSQLEHRDLLREAVESFHSRFFVSTHNLRGGVVNDEFISGLERGLRSGAEVTVVYDRRGDRAADRDALSRLAEVQRRTGGRLKLTRAPTFSTNALIWDNCWVVSSFDWLGYRGDLPKIFHRHEGTLVKLVSDVDDAYQRLLREALLVLQP